MVKYPLSKQQKTIRMGIVEHDIIEHFSNFWGTNPTVTIRRIIREFDEIKKDIKVEDKRN